MPNWCRNILQIKGSAHDLEAFLTRAAKGSNSFAMDALYPMPSDLDIEDSSIGSIGYQAFFGNVSQLLKYDWIQKEGITSGEELMAFLDEKNPEYRRLGELYMHNIKKYGVPTYYEWANKYWGTKWSAAAEHIEVNTSKTKAVIDFDTAWSPPVPWLTKVSEDFPRLSFRMTYEESGEAFTGFVEVQDGTVSKSDSCYMWDAPEGDPQYPGLCGYVSDPDGKHRAGATT